MFFISKCKGAACENFNYMVNDDIKSGYLATSHIIERGKKKIYFLNGP